MKKLLIVAVAFLGCSQTLYAAKIVNNVGFQLIAVNVSNNKQTTISNRKSMKVNKGEKYQLYTNTYDGLGLSGTLVISEDKDYSISTNKDASDQHFWIEANKERIG